MKNKIKNKLKRNNYFIFGIIILFMFTLSSFVSAQDYGYPPAQYQTPYTGYSQAGYSGSYGSLNTNGYTGSPGYYNNQMSSPMYGNSYGYASSGNTFSYSQVQRYQPSYSTYYTPDQMTTYWPILGQSGMCGQNSQDFLVQVSPLLGCTPYVVRSDLLAEQNVPVFCQLDSMQINPLINVAAIDHISLMGTNYPQGVSGIGFHPARVALNSPQTGSLNNPILNNIGYVVVVLQRTPNESSMPDFIEGNLTATLNYDIQKAFGIGLVSQMLPVLSDEEWALTYKQYGFWQGRAYARAEEVGVGEVQIGIYSSVDKKIATIRLDSQNKKSGITYIPGMYCRAGITAELVETSYPKPSVVIKVDSDSYTVGVGQTFYNGRCRITSINPDSSGGATVGVSCPQAPFSLILGSKSVGLAVSGTGNVVNQNYKAGDKLTTTTDSKNVYLGGIVYGNVNGVVSRYAILVKTNLASTNYALTNVLGYIADYSSRNPNVADSSFSTKLQDDLISKFPISRTAIASPRSNSPMAPQSSLDYEIKVLPEGTVDANAFFGVGFPQSEVSNSDINCDGTSSSTNDASGTSKSSCETFKSYFNKAKDSYYKLGEEFSSEKELNGNFYADDGFSSFQEFARTTNMFDSQRQIVEKWNQIYPESVNAQDAKSKINLNSNIDYSAASRVTLIDGKSVSVSLDRVIMPNTDNVNVITDVITSTPGKAVKYNRDLKLKLSSDVPMDSDSPADTIRLEEVYDSYVIATVYCSSTSVQAGATGTAPGSYRTTLTLGQSTPVCNAKYKINLKSIDYKRVAMINLYPYVPSATSTVNFSFHIGIEKRAIEITPEVAMDRIKALNETIKEWEEISDNLRNVLKVWKGTCLGVTGALVVKNFFTNLDGGATARKMVMAQWRQYCTGMIGDGEGKYSTLTRCYEAHADEIDKDFNLQKQLIKEQNDDLSKNNADGNTDGFFNSADDNVLGKKYYSTNGLGSKIATVDWGDDMSAKNKYTQIYIDASIDPAGNNGKNTLSIYDARQMETDLGIINSPDASKIYKDRAKADLKQNLERVSQNNQYVKSMSDTSAMTPQSLPGAKPATVMNYRGKTWANYKSSEFIDAQIDHGGGESSRLLNDQDKIEYISGTGGRNYLVELEGSSAGALTIGGIYLISTAGGVKEAEYINPSLINDKSYEDVKNDYNNIQSVSFAKAGSYHTKINNPEVIYYTAAPYDGLPVQVPFDVTNGWYAVVQPTVLGMGSQGIQDASGSINNFWVCNVGDDGVMDGVGTQDLCAMYNVGTAPISAFNGLDLYQTQSLVKKAYRGLRDAASQYKKDIKQVTINGVRMNVKSKSTTVPATECGDVMPIEDCVKIFNVCDPVICPSSRCNLGGRMTVDNVIASGIAGSIALCLPNFVGFGGDVIVPVCLTGIQAGIDNFISILKSTRDCLQERLATGQYVGICDEMTSVYMCQFFWNNAAPFVKGGFSGLLGMISGENNKGKGGGEYLTVSDAWQNAQDSVSYLTNSYGASSYQAFQIRSTQDAGFKFCKSFVGVSVPSAIDNALEPDSPSQFYATVEELPFTTVTVPATSQYKVFYQIYAGKDQGVFYQIYLRNSLQQTSNYGIVGGVTSSEQFVTQGYIAKGGQASQAKDFTFPQGYTELCIVINQKENCGFKTVTSSYGLNYLRDKYAQEQASETITTASACVSGTPSLYSMAQPNVQSGVQSMVSPQLYANTGIVRACATSQPGKATDASRWVEVGYCDTTSVKCWMDKNSVSAAIQDRALRAETLGDAQQIVESSLMNGSILTGTIATDAINKFKSDYTTTSALSSFAPNSDFENKFEYAYSDLSGRLFLSTDKAKLLFIKAGIYTSVAGQYRQQFKVNAADSAQTKILPSTVTPETSGAQTTSTKKCGEMTDKNLCTDATFLSENSANNLIGKCYWSKGFDFVVTFGSKCVDCPNSLPTNFNTFSSDDCTNFCSGCTANFKCFWNVMNNKCEINSGWTIGKVMFSGAERDAIIISPTKLYFNVANGWYLNDYSTIDDNIVLSDSGRVNAVQIKSYLDNFLTYPSNSNPVSIGSSSSTGGVTGNSVGMCNDVACQNFVGEKIMELARTYQSNHPGISDDKIKSDTGGIIPNFPCLIAHIAMQEEDLSHCDYDVSQSTNYLYCDGNSNTVIKGDNGNSIGVMQINIPNNPKYSTSDMASLDKNVNAAIDILMSGYPSSSPSQVLLDSGTKNSYIGWTVALKKYNGWGKPLHYVEQLLGKENRGNQNVHDDLVAALPQCAPTSSDASSIA